MKIRILPLFLSLLLLNACNETDEQPQNNGGAGETPTNEFKLSIKASDVFSATSDLSVIITIEKADGTKELDAAKLTLTPKEDFFITEKLELSDGTLKITNLLVVDGAENVVMAAPMSSSLRATDANQALPLSFTKNDKAVVVVGVPVAETDLPTEFGYPKMAFGVRPYVKVTVVPEFTVGTIRYSPISKIKVYSGEWVTEFESSTETELLLPKKLNSYNFESRVWGYAHTKIFSVAELKANSRVNLNIITDPRKIKSEVVSVSLSSGGSVVNSKRDYTYNADGTLDNIYHYLKKEDSDELGLSYVSKFEYSNGRLIQIKRSLENEIGYTKFTYTTSGKIEGIEEKSYDMLTTASVTYDPANANLIKINYRFYNGNTMIYNITYENQNKKEDGAFGNGSETGTYQYDAQINPFYFLNFQDMFLSRTSKNNLIGENKNYGGNIPSLEIYKFDYHYDEQGYPELLIKSFRGYTSKEHVMREFTEYTYY